MLVSVLPRPPEGTHPFCVGAHFPEGVNATACGCTTGDCSNMSGWPNEEYYVPHSGTSKVHDGHWSAPAARMKKHDKTLHGHREHKTHGRKNEV